jgi:uncharacterized membrane protein YdcZ (DUF606 family)
MVTRTTAPPRPAKTPRYAWLGGGLSPAQRRTVIVALLSGGALADLYHWYATSSSDVSPDSVFGYGFAIAGTLLLLLVGIGYVLRKRVRRNWAHTLHTMLSWHIVGGMLGLLLILMHAAGNFHPRSGTYALYALLALVASGIIGRLIDRLAPRYMAGAALQTLTSDGEERLEVLVGTLGEQKRPAQETRSRASQSKASGTPMDLAYYDLEVDPEAIPTLLRQQTPAAGAAGGAPLAAARREPSRPVDLAGATTVIQRAIGSERFYRQLVRVWRRLHTLLSLLTLGLLLWHLEYATVLLIGAR